MRDLLADGLSDREVARISGVPQTTVSRWRRATPPIPIRWRPAHPESYAYLLGLYLGDGWLYVGRSGGTVLRICLDHAYPRVIDDCWSALILSMPQCRPSLLQRPGMNAVLVCV